ncbi:MAG: CcmD family protein [Bacteroidota bacterium]
MQSTAVDTLTQSYSQKWDAAGQMEEAGPIMQFMASNDLIFVVLGVSLIIWLVLLFTLFRVDRKVRALEEQLEETDNRLET